MPMSSSQSPRHERDVVPAWPRGPRPSGVKNNQFTSERRSIGRRIVRTLARFFIAVLIGVGVTLAWQSHGDEAKEMVRTWAPSLAWLLPVSTTKSPPDGQGFAAATSAELVQQLKPLTLDLAIVRHSLEQLAAKVEQLGSSKNRWSRTSRHCRRSSRTLHRRYHHRLSPGRPLRANPRNPPRRHRPAVIVSASPVASFRTALALA